MCQDITWNLLPDHVRQDSSGALKTLAVSIIIEDKLVIGQIRKRVMCCDNLHTCEQLHSG